MTADFIESLTSVNSYRDFIKVFLKVHPNVTQAELSRRAAFSSRSTLTQILGGKRKPSLKSLHSLSRAMKLEPITAKPFHCLAELEIPEIFLNPRQRRQIQKEIKILQSTLKQGKIRRSVTFIPNEIKDIMSLQDFPVIYAALGDSQSGASLDEIVSRTHLSKNDVEQALAKAEQINLVSKDGDRYYPKDFHLNLSKQNRSAFMRELCLRNFERSYFAAKNRFSEKESLFHFSHLCVKEEDLPRLKEELRELILRFVDDSYDVQGDTVSILSLSHFSIKNSNK